MKGLHCFFWRDVNTIHVFNESPAFSDNSLQHCSISHSALLWACTILHGYISNSSLFCLFIRNQKTKFILFRGKIERIVNIPCQLIFDIFMSPFAPSVSLYLSFGWRQMYYCPTTFNHKNYPSTTAVTVTLVSFVCKKIAMDYWFVEKKHNERKQPE